MKAKKTPVFIFPWYSNPPGDGLHGMTACFINLGIHVPFTVKMHSENMYFDTVGIALSCDDSCGHGKSGSLHDLSDPKDTYYFPRVVKAANRAAARIRKPTRKRKILEPPAGLLRPGMAKRIRKAVEAVSGKMKEKKGDRKNGRKR